MKKGETVRATWVITCLTQMSVVGMAGPSTMPNDARRFGGSVDFEGSTILSLVQGFDPELIYRKFPPGDAVGPGDTWELGIAVDLDAAETLIPATLQLDPANPHPDMQIVDGSAALASSDGVFHNYESGERFVIEYTGLANPFTGFVDFLMEPQGFAAISIRVHLAVIDQQPFPLPLDFFAQETVELGNLTGDAKREIIVECAMDGQRALRAFDSTGQMLSGWPFFDPDPAVVDESFGCPTLADLDGDGLDEVLVVAALARNLPGGGTENPRRFHVLDGSGAVQWELEATLDPSAVPAVADLDGDVTPDVIVASTTNLLRFDSDGNPAAEWQVEADVPVHVFVPVLADVDANPADGLEIVACTPVFGPPTTHRMYVWNQDGTLQSSAWPKTVEICVTPTVVDLDGDSGNGLEIILPVNHTPPPVQPGTGFLNTLSVHAWHADGSDVSGWPHDFFRDPAGPFADDRIPFPATAADLDGDGDVEVVVGTYGQFDPAGGNLFVFHHDGTLDPNWPRWAGVAQTPSSLGGPALGDLDNDGKLEIVTGSVRGVSVFRPNGLSFDGFPKLALDIFTHPVVADLDADGRLEVVSLSLSQNMLAWKTRGLALGGSPWPVHRQNPAHTGTYLRDASAAIPAVSTWTAAGILVLLMVSGVSILCRRSLNDTPVRG